MMQLLPWLSGTSKPLHEKELPASLDLFGWCTWDAFYSTVSARGLQEGLHSFAEGGLQPRFVIIDDGWQVRDPFHCVETLWHGLLALPASLPSSNKSCTHCPQRLLAYNTIS
jgi:hypothetical protein